MRQVIDLGWCIGAIIKDKGRGFSINITSPAFTESGFFEPAQTVIVFGEPNIVALRDALTAALDAKE